MNWETFKTDNISSIPAPGAWTEAMEHLPYWVGIFEGATPEQAWELFCAGVTPGCTVVYTPQGDEVFTAHYERETYEPEQGWDWFPCTREQATRVSISKSSARHSAAMAKFAEVGGARYGYKDRS